MFLEKVCSLPHKVLKRLDDEINHLNIYLVQDYDLKLLNSIVDFSTDIFGDASMDEWGIVPQIRRGNVFLLKEEEYKQVAGLALLMRDWNEPNQAYLFDFAIAPDYQGNGIGFHFLKGIIDNLIEQGFEGMNLTVDVNNKGAIRLYEEKLGFKRVTRGNDEYGKGHHRYTMVLDFEDYKEKFDIQPRIRMARVMAM